MKILLANKFYRPGGGPETGMRLVVKDLEVLGHTVIPFSMHDPRNYATEYEKYFVSNIDYENHSRLPWDLAKSALKIIYNVEARKKIEQLIIDTKPDIAHMRNIYHQLSPSILLPLKRHNIPVVMTLHDFKMLCPNYTFMRNKKPCEECQGKYFYKAIKYKCVKNSYLKSTLCALEMYIHKKARTYIDAVDCFIALSRFTQGKMIEYGLPKEKIFYLPNYINIPDFTPKRQKEKYVLFLGMLSDKNGSYNLTCAMRSLPEIKLKIAGVGPQRSLIENYIRENNMKNVELLGFLTGERLQEVTANCTFLAFPNNCYHNCPMSILEAFSYGKPVIGARLGSVPECIEDGKNGLLFQPGNVEDLARKIRYLYERPKLVRMLGQDGLEKVKRNYSKENHYERLLGLYQDLVEKKKIGNHAYTQTNINISNNKPSSRVLIANCVSGVAPDTTNKEKVSADLRIIKEEHLSRKSCKTLTVSLD